MLRRPPRAPCGQLVRRDRRRRSRTPGLSTYPGKGRRSMPDLSALLASADAAHDEIVTLLQDLVRIPTINTGSRPDTGGETRVCEVLRPKLAQAGIACEVHESAPGRGNLIARLGPAGHQRLLFMSHTDVVPVEDETLWEHPPFSATLERGRVYGRGADDDKADVAAYCMALVLLARAGVNLGGELIYLAAADEESGGRWGAGWVADHLPDKVRADVAINEGGGVPVHTPDGLLYQVCTGEKGRLEAHITRQGRSGHASRPWAADNPVPVLAEAIQRIAAYEPEIDVSHPFFREVLQAFGVKQAPTAENIDRIADGLHAQPGLSSLLKATSRMTITPTRRVSSPTAFPTGRSWCATCARCPVKTMGLFNRSSSTSWAASRWRSTSTTPPFRTAHRPTRHSSMYCGKRSARLWEAATSGCCQRLPRASPIRASSARWAPRSTAFRRTTRAPSPSAR